MRQCNICGKYMSMSIRYIAGEPVVSYSCECGYYYPSNNILYASDKTDILKNNKFINTDHIESENIL